MGRGRPVRLARRRLSRAPVREASLAHRARSTHRELFGGSRGVGAQAREKSLGSYKLAGSVRDGRLSPRKRFRRRRSSCRWSASSFPPEGVPRPPRAAVLRDTTPLPHSSQPVFPESRRILPPLVRGRERDEERGGRIRPPPSEDGVQGEARERKRGRDPIEEGHPASERSRGGTRDLPRSALVTAHPHGRRDSQIGDPTPAMPADGR